MILKLIHWLQGIVQLEIKGFSPERFFNLCSLNGIEIWDLIYENGRCRLSMILPDFWKIRAFARKSGVRVKVAGRQGLPFFVQRNRKRKLYFLGTASFFALLYGLSLFIWDISFSGNYRYTEDTLGAFLEERGIACGVKKNQVDCEELEAALRSGFPEITWVSARVSGTRLYIQIKENEVLSKIEEQARQPCNIVADFSGTITEMIVRSGVPMVSVGDTVEEGQLLVSGFVPVTNDADEVVKTNLVQADADITARSSGSYCQSFPLLHSVTVDTGNERAGFFIRIGPFSARFLLPSREGSTWRTSFQEHQLSLFGDFCLPVWWGRIRSSQCISYERSYTERELEKKAQAIHQTYLKNLSEKGVHIIENNVKILKDASLCHVEGNFVGEGPVGRAEAIAGE